MARPRDSHSQRYTPREIARAAGVTEALVRSRLGVGTGWDTLVTEADAVHAVRTLGVPSPPSDGTRPPLFAVHARVPTVAGGPVALSGMAHLLVLGTLMLATGLGADALGGSSTAGLLEPLRLVYLVAPGPGGGGGGGGLRHRTEAPMVQKAGTSRLSSPVPAPMPTPLFQPQSTTPPLPSESLPLVTAPVVSMPSDAFSRPGVIDGTVAESVSQGPGSGGGSGTGSGTGMGSGSGSGIGAGWGGGIGGGPYRPGSGVEPPAVLRETKPSYTDDAHAQGITGEVVLDVVVRADGSVGQVRVKQGLGYGLDERAIDAVRKWLFRPATRLGTPVDVLVEVAVEFRLR